MQKRNYARAHKPEWRQRRDGSGYWRVRTVDGDGRRGSRIFEGEGAEKLALGYVKAYNKDASARGVTLEAAVTMWIDWHRENEYRPATLVSTERKIRRLLDMERNGDESVAWLMGKGQKLYDTFRTSKSQLDPSKSLSSSTHILALDVAKRFGGWLVKRKLLSSNPFEAVEKVGRVRHGGEKPALTTTEAQAFLAAADAYGNRVAATAATLAVFTGLRASELVGRTVRDLDGDTLWVTGALKTRTSTRQVQLSPELAERLRAVAGGRPDDAPLFWPPSKDSTDAPTVRWLWYAISRIGKAAKITVPVNSQLCRRTVSRLTTQIGMAAPLLQAHLGHRLGTSVTETSYVGRTVAEQARADRLNQLLGPKPAGNDATRTVPGAENGPAATSTTAPVSRREDPPMALCTP